VGLIFGLGRAGARRARGLDLCNVEQARAIAAQGERIAELERRLAADLSRSSRPPSSDAQWDKQPARKRSSRGQSGRKPGRQPGSASASRSLIDDSDETFEVAPDRCARCEQSLHDAAETGRVRRQVVDVEVPPPPKVTEYPLVSRRCGGCGHVNDPAVTDVPRPVDPGSDVARRAAGAPPRGRYPRACRDRVGHCAPRDGCRPRSRGGAGVVSGKPGPDRPADHRVGGTIDLTGIRVSSGFLAGVRGRAAALLDTEFLPHL
jgi:hypothetical protein